MKLFLTDLPMGTSSLLNLLAKEKFMSRFSLVGGTALALQINHRQSEDLDFVFVGEKIDATGIKRFISRLFPQFRIIREEAGYQLDFLIGEVKLTFFSTGAVLIPFSVKEYTFKFGKLNISNVSTLAVLKMATLSQRCTMRDYYDIYYLAKHVIPLSEIYNTTRLLIPFLSPITYSETIIYTRDIPENSISAHLSPKEMITKDQIAEFFIGEIRKMKAGPRAIENRTS